MVCAPGQCQDEGACDPATGACVYPDAADDTACDDGDACTRADSCQAGVCIGADPVTCVALDQCHTAGTCDPAAGVCSDPAKPDDTACDDGSACTTADRCVAGTCESGTATTCVALDQCHTAGTCDPATGVCSTPAKPDDTACDDVDACTTGDRCVAGACESGTAMTCSALDQCHDPGVCDPATGICSDPERPDGSACSSGECRLGECVGRPDAGHLPDDGGAGTDAGNDDVSDAGEPISPYVLVGCGCSTGDPAALLLLAGLAAGGRRRRRA